MSDTYADGISEMSPKMGPSPILMRKEAVKFGRLLCFAPVTIIALFGFDVTFVTSSSKRLRTPRPAYYFISELGQRPGPWLSTMSHDFLRLVSQANPASSQYQPANGRYPPAVPAVPIPYSDRSTQQMDPFFDDEDIPDSAFGPPSHPMHSQESGLPLSDSAALPAGVGFSDSSKGIPQDWNFDDDDEFQASNSQNIPGPSSFPSSTTKRPIASIPKLKSRKWKWPWQKEKVLTGERIIALNNSSANVDFCSNFVSTSKYNLATFLPKFLFGTLVFITAVA